MTRVVRTPGKSQENPRKVFVSNWTCFLTCSRLSQTDKQSTFSSRKNSGVKVFEWNKRQGFVAGIWNNVLRTQLWIPPPLTVAFEAARNAWDNNDFLPKLLFFFNLDCKCNTGSLYSGKSQEKPRKKWEHMFLADLATTNMAITNNMGCSWIYLRNRKNYLRFWLLLCTFVHVSEKRYSRMSLHMDKYERSWQNAEPSSNRRVEPQGTHTGQ